MAAVCQLEEYLAVFRSLIVKPYPHIAHVGLYQNIVIVILGIECKRTSQYRNNKEQKDASQHYLFI